MAADSGTGFFQDFFSESILRKILYRVRHPNRKRIKNILTNGTKYGTDNYGMVELERIESKMFRII